MNATMLYTYVILKQQISHQKRQNAVSVFIEQVNYCPSLTKSVHEVETVLKKI